MWSWWAAPPPASPPRSRRRGRAGPPSCWSAPRTSGGCRPTASAQPTSSRAARPAACSSTSSAACARITSRATAPTPRRCAIVRTGTGLSRRWRSGCWKGCSPRSPRSACSGSANSTPNHETSRPVPPAWHRSGSSTAGRGARAGAGTDLRGRDLRGGSRRRRGRGVPRRARGCPGVQRANGGQGLQGVARGDRPRLGRSRRAARLDGAPGRTCPRGRTCGLARGAWAAAIGSTPGNRGNARRRAPGPHGGPEQPAAVVDAARRAVPAAEPGPAQSGNSGCSPAEPPHRGPRPGISPASFAAPRTTPR